MGFGDLASVAIMFIAVILAMAGITLLLTNNISDVTTSISRRQEDIADKMQSDMAIDHVFYTDAPEHRTAVYVKNIGAIALDPQKMTIFIDNDFIYANSTAVNITILSDANQGDGLLLETNDVALINISRQITTNGVHTLKLIAEYENQATKIFTT
jgi:archaellum component FlaG (FlaF/FlaG flagellin family)